MSYAREPDVLVAIQQRIHAMNHHELAAALRASATPSAPSSIDPWVECLWCEAMARLLDDLFNHEGH